MILVTMIPLLWIGLSISSKLLLWIYIFVSFLYEQNFCKNWQSRRIIDTDYILNTWKYYMLLPKTFDEYIQFWIIILLRLHFLSINQLSKYISWGAKSNRCCLFRLMKVSGIGEIFGEPLSSSDLISTTVSWRMILILYYFSKIDPHKIIFTDEKWFYLTFPFNGQNVRYWSVSNTHVYDASVEQGTEKFMAWAGIDNGRVYHYTFSRRSCQEWNLFCHKRIFFCHKWYTFFH